jgi:hypothetical protein
LGIGISKTIRQKPNRTRIDGIRQGYDSQGKL